MATMEINYIIHADGTMYRVRPNPDSDCTTGKDGIVLEWKDAGDSMWSNYTYFPAEVVPFLTEALKKFELK